MFFHGGGRQPPAQYARLSYQRWPFEVGKLKANECPLWFCVVRGVAWHASTTSLVLAAARHMNYCPVILDKEDLRFPNYGLNEKVEVAFRVKIFAYPRSRAGTVLGSLGSMHCCLFCNAALVLKVPGSSKIPRLFLRRTFGLHRRPTKAVFGSEM